MPSSDRNSDDNDASASDSPVRGRGRGRPRGRKRTRSRSASRNASRSSSRGRGSKRRVTTAVPASLPVEADTLEECIEHAKERIAELDEERVRELLLAMVDRHPSLVLDVMEPVRVGEHGGHHPPAGGSFPDWCTCTKCREMPTQAEKVCCGRMPGYCTSDIPAFRMLILNKAVLAIARLYRQDLLAIEDEEDPNRANRYASYRQYTLWVHGRLGQGIRKAIPSCCLLKIRDKFPDAFGQYQGFIPSRIG